MVGNAGRENVQSLEAFVAIPAGQARLGSREGRSDEQPRSFETPGFRLGRDEVTAAAYAEFLQAEPPPDGFTHPQFELRGGRWQPRAGFGRKPVTGLTGAEADAYCAWFGRRHGVTARLPTEAEWEYAARGGLPRGRYPWGWGAPEGRACLAADGPRDVGSFAPNRYGCRDMAGNVWEWCRPETAEDGDAFARGGSWAEKHPETLRVFHRGRFRRDYRNGDVGFRVLIEDH